MQMITIPTVGPGITPTPAQLGAMKMGLESANSLDSVTMGRRRRRSRRRRY